MKNKEKYLVIRFSNQNIKKGTRAKFDAIARKCDENDKTLNKLFNENIDKILAILNESA